MIAKQKILFQQKNHRNFQNMEIQWFFKPKIGLEPTTPSLRVKCTTDCAISANMFSVPIYYTLYSKNSK